MKYNNSKTLISVVGPTAIGKTKLAIDLAQHYKTEVLSADSRQFFKEMTIGTAVPSKEELASIKHNFIQHRSILEAYSVGDFERDAITLLKSIFLKHNVIIMVGGSGLYIDAVTKGLDNFPKVDQSIREELNADFESNGLTVLQEKLKTLDPKYYNKVDLENPHRLIRALEVCIGSGRPYSSFLNQEKSNRPFNVITVGIDADREKIYERINKRVDHMIDVGLLEEAKALLPYKTLNAMQTVGYRELFKYFDGEWELEFAISEIKKNTRRFAKRQLTWFKKSTETIWISYNDNHKTVLEKINL